MNLQQLKYAVEIARVGSISKAAKNLYMGQPNLSKSIKELEAELGQTLFSRTARGVQPTRAGEDFLGYARSILSQVESLSQLYRKDGAPAARLHMAAPRASYISNAFSAFAAQLSATGTALDLDYRETNSMDILHAVASGEAELGILKGKEEEGTEGTNESMYTDPVMAVDFIERSGCDSLAISIGTCHGLVKMVPREDGTLPDLKYDILQYISDKKPGFPIVLHGCSNISQTYVDMINQHGGHIEKTVGIPDEQVRKAAGLAVCKINIATDGWICGLANTRRILDEEPGAIDSRCFTLKIRPLMKELYLHKIEIMGSGNRA